MNVTDDELLAKLLQGKNQATVARELGMTKTAICRRVNKPSFQAQLSAYRKQVIDVSLNYLTSGAHKAVDTLLTLLNDNNPFVRLQAACKILAIIQDYSVQNDLMQQVEELKASQNALVTTYNDEQQ